MKLTIGYLYGDCMNIYGDTGNIITLKKRCEWRGIDVEVKNISIGDRLKSGEVDLYFFGGGQDLAQKLVSEDLKKSKGRLIKKDVEEGIPLLSICGGYQLLGEYYAPFNEPKLEGIGLFKAYTNASTNRMIGNIVVETEFGKLVGFENHSGKTYLKAGAKPLGKVLKGFGNNGEDQTEGCMYKNAIGCYMHGSLLPKNPKLADWLITKALKAKYNKDIVLTELDDRFEINAKKSVLDKFG